MGRGNELELPPSDDELTSAEADTRLLLARYGEPRAIEPPPGLAARVVATLAQTVAAPAPERRPRVWLRPAVGWGVAVAALLLALGVWGALTDRLTQVAGGPHTLLGRLALSLTQAVRPLADLLVSIWPGIALAFLALAAAAWLWWRLARER